MALQLPPVKTTSGIDVPYFRPVKLVEVDFLSGEATIVFGGFENREHRLRGGPLFRFAFTVSAERYVRAIRTPRPAATNAEESISACIYELAKEQPFFANAEDV